MNNTATHNIDASNALALLRPARMELGIRDAKTDGHTLSFRIGCGAATAWVSLTVSALDLFDFEIVKVRGARRTVLASSADLFADQLASVLVSTWCAVCSAKGW